METAPRNVILQGDVLDRLRELPNESVQCVVTSPPYWNLRDYGMPGQIGLEATPDEWLARMVAVFAEVRRVLREDGTLWCNIGDAYASAWSCSRRNIIGNESPSDDDRRINRLAGGLKEKDLIGLPWMLAFALRADGWYLRSDIVWAKPNPMPESVTDRPTKAHEYLFLLAKSQRYHYDAEAISEAVTGGAHARAARYTKMPDGWDTGRGGHGSFHRRGREKGRRVTLAPGVTPKSAPAGSGIKANESFHAATTQLVERRNKRSVWTIATQAFAEAHAEAHFATFPTALIEPCIAAGARAGDLVLDPFMGSGTVGVVCRRMGRDYLGIELNPAYVAMAGRRIAREQQPMLLYAPRRDAVTA